ncbi:unnamed protein product [marine sediment metagenome]|uniref:Uncharacterized protein n=1 Tax=marine sediment metagenome TaxID=412755 RepID=X0SKG2_9ZZZZ
MRIFTKGREKGQWWGLDWGTKRTATIVCPDCGFTAVVRHDIADDGTVTPSVVCPEDCGFHEMIKLEGWEP